MCVTLFLPDGTEVTDEAKLIEEVRKARPDLSLQARGPFATCLCGINFEVLAELVGWRLERKGGDVYATRRCDA